MTLNNIVPDFDIKDLDSTDFKEDSVREVIILPILKKLGYDNHQIVRSKGLRHPFVNIGSKKEKIEIIPDYLLRVDDSYAWVLDAKSPKENILQGKNVEQAYSYAIHPEIRTKYYALCNGKEFAIFRIDNSEAVLFFKIEDIEYYWNDLNKLLSSSSFYKGPRSDYEGIVKESTSVNYDHFDYLNRPLLKEIKVQKQKAKRHFGVHGYFTKQSWNVVAEYIKNYSKPGDLVLDSFGGAGVTAVEALMNRRKAIHIDLNPLSVFIISSLIAPVEINKMLRIFENIVDDFKKNEPLNDAEIEKILNKNDYPRNIKLPKNSDVDYIEQLFTKKQLADLSLLKMLIIKYTKSDENIKKSLLLAFSSSINKYNLTFHYAKSAGGGNSGAFIYYRYRIAPEPGNLNLVDIFKTKFQKVLNAKNEISTKINTETINNIVIIKGSATNLSSIQDESVDYVYTDPPYGSKIPYLDLSIIWNAWLDLEVTEEDYNNEAIEGGEHNKSKYEYADLIIQSLRQLYRVLKYDRWMSFVFAHKDPEFWHLIVDNAEKIGFEYAGAVKQSNGQTSFKKRQNPFTVLAGQLIINFKKVRKPRTILKANLGLDVFDLIRETVEGVIAKNAGATLEEINDELILKGLENGFLDLLKDVYNDLTKYLMNEFDYDKETEKYSIRPDKKFKSNIDIRLRIRYYLISYLRRMELQNEEAHFDDIILNIMPKLKNGITPEKQTIQSVLDDIAEKQGNDSWILKNDDQLKMFGHI